MDRGAFTGGWLIQLGWYHIASNKAGAMPSSSKAKSSRPNFLLFITDQHRADFLGCYGHPVLRTPNIDSIARRGTAFDRFYVASPVCQPNRASLMTGRMPSVHDVRSNGIPLSMEAVTFVDLLRDAGYRTALVGKSHLQNFTRTIRSSSGGRRARAFMSRRRICASRSAITLTIRSMSRKRRRTGPSPARMCRRHSTASTM